MIAMRNRSFWFLFISIFLWATGTYFFLFYKESETVDHDKLSKHLETLKNELDDLILTNNRLLEELRNSDAFKNAQLKKSSSSSDDNTEEKKKTQNFSIVSEQENDAIPAQQNNEEKKIENDIPKAETLHYVPKNKLPDGSPVIPILVISCNRISVKRCLDQLFKYRPRAEQFPIIVSQDCNDQHTSDVIEEYIIRENNTIHIQQPDQSDIDVPPKEKKFKGYFKIARHYGWALNQTFFTYKYDSVIIVEDDLEVAPDFFDYFLGTHPILVADPTLWCVSAWNDNGKPYLVDVNNPSKLYRTDFFPGLGWMLTKNLWEELAPKWPKAYWDDWIREPEQRKERACIRPELSRTKTFGKIGVSNGMFYEKHLKFIYLNEVKVPFAEMNLTYLLKNNYDSKFKAEVEKSQVITYDELKANKMITSESFKILYHTRQSYKYTTKMLGLMDDFKSGVPRTGYLGIVTFFFTGRRIHLAPGTHWTGYNPSWS